MPDRIWHDGALIFHVYFFPCRPLFRVNEKCICIPTCSNITSAYHTVCKWITTFSHRHKMCGDNFFDSFSFHVFLFLLQDMPSSNNKLESRIAKYHRESYKIFFYAKLFLFRNKLGQCSILILMWHFFYLLHICAPNMNMLFWADECDRANVRSIP